MELIRRVDAITGKLDHLVINTHLRVGDDFRLIGNTETFKVVKTYKAAGFIPSVVGVSEGKQRRITHARVVDTCRHATIEELAAKICQIEAF